MPAINISVYQGGIQDNNNYEYSLRTNIANPPIFGNQYYYEDVDYGLYYYTVRKKATGEIVASGEVEVKMNLVVEPYVGTHTGTQITIPKSVHGKNKVSSVLVMDLDGFIIQNSYRIISGQDPYDEAVDIFLAENQTVKVRIS